MDLYYPNQYSHIQHRVAINDCIVNFYDDLPCERCGKEFERKLQNGWEEGLVTIRARSGRVIYYCSQNCFGLHNHKGQK